MEIPYLPASLIPKPLYYGAQIPRSSNLTNRLLLLLVVMVRKDSVSLFYSTQTGSSLGQEETVAGPAMNAEPGATIIVEPGSTTIAEPGATIIA